MVLSCQAFDHECGPILRDSLQTPSPLKRQGSTDGWKYPMGEQTNMAPGPRVLHREIRSRKTGLDLVELSSLCDFMIPGGERAEWLKGQDLWEG